MEFIFWGNSINNIYKEGVIMIVPRHIKELVSRIVVEYDKAAEAGTVFFSSIKDGEREYHGVDATRFLLSEVKSFKALLDRLEDPYFDGDEKEIAKKIFMGVDSYLEVLGAPEIYNVICTIKCQNQLSNALRRNIKKNTAYKKDAERIMHAIDEAKTSCFTHTDEGYRQKKFVLVQEEAIFNSIVAKPGVSELTKEATEPFVGIKVAFEPISEREQYKEKSLLRKYKHLLMNVPENESFDLHFKIMNFWFGIGKKAIYHVYIPKA